MFNLYAQGSTNSPFMSFLPLIFIFLIFYFLLIRPNSKKQKLLNKKRAAMSKGDKVIISGGIFGKISHEKKDGNVMVVEIAPQIKIEVLRTAIVDVVLEDDEIKKRNTKELKQSKK